KRARIERGVLTVKEKALYNIGMAFLYKNMIREAEDYLKKLITQFPKNAKGYLQLGNLYDMKEDFEVARGFYEKSISLDDKDAVTHYNFAVALENHGELTKAIKHYKLAIDIKPGWEIPKKALARVVSGNQ
ncbi:tetratricopeptide repeat protein, partial [Thermodesulfobacteriota bacterium]